MIIQNIITPPSKYEVIKAFGADIFFDDQDTHLEHTSKEIPSAKVPYKR